jgi:hypothetical protein
MNLDDTLQNGRYMHCNIYTLNILTKQYTECITKQLALSFAVAVACVQ